MKKISWITPVVTVFKENGELDENGNLAVYEFLINHGIEAIVIMGSTGEFFSMPVQQKKN